MFAHSPRDDFPLYYGHSCPGASAATLDGMDKIYRYQVITTFGLIWWSQYCCVNGISWTRLCQWTIKSMTRWIHRGQGALNYILQLLWPIDAHNKRMVIHTPFSGRVYPVKYTHDFVVLVWLDYSIILNGHTLMFTHIIQGCLIATRAITWLLQHKGNNSGGCMKGKSVIIWPQKHDIIKTCI